MNMVEKVARAIYEASPFRETSGEYDEPSEIYRRMCRLFARAAIEAMRECDNSMLEAMHIAMFTDVFDGSSLPMLGSGFEAAIDAALTE